MTQKITIYSSKNSYAQALFELALENNSTKIVKSQIFGDKIKLFKVLNNLYRPLYIKGFNKEMSYHKKIAELIRKVPIYMLTMPRSLSAMEDWINKNEFNL